MGNIENFSDYELERKYNDFTEITFYKKGNISYIKYLRKRVGLECDDYIGEVLKLLKSGKNILGEHQIKNQKLPYHIKTHIDKLDTQKCQDIVQTINYEIIPDLKKSNTKKEVFILRNYLIYRIKKLGENEQ